MINVENGDKADEPLLCVEEIGDGDKRICVSLSSGIDLDKEFHSLNLGEVAAIITAVRLYINTRNGGNGKNANNHGIHIGLHNGNGVSPWLYSWLEEATRNIDFNPYSLRKNFLFSNNQY